MLCRIKTPNTEMLTKESSFVHPVLQMLALRAEGSQAFVWDKMLMSGQLLNQC